MEKELSNVKKSLSTMVLKTKQKEYSINRYKNELSKIERDLNIVKGQSESSQNVKLNKI